MAHYEIVLVIDCGGDAAAEAEEKELAARRVVLVSGGASGQVTVLLYAPP